MFDKSVRNNETKDKADGVLPLLSAQTLAKRLRVSVRTLWRLRSAGKLPRPLRIGHSIRWRADEIDAWIRAGCPPVGK